MRWKEKFNTVPVSGDKVIGKPKEHRKYKYGERHPINSGQQIILDGKYNYDSELGGYWYSIKNDGIYLVLDVDVKKV